MNWKECVRMLEQYEPGDRFTWPDPVFGFDCDPEAFTVSDVWGVISWIWTYPGDWVLSKEPVGTFFEFEGATVVGALGSTILGWFLFVILVSLIPD